MAIFAFELAREIAVIEGAAGAKPNVQNLVGSFGPEGSRFITATGRWERNDGGDKLVPTTVTIQCREELGQCIEATTTIIDQSVFAPDVSFYPAKFGDGTVTYTNDDPSCARYSVRIDVKLKLAVALRERKVATGDCARLEPSLRSQLVGTDYGESKKMLDGHFLPIMKLIAAMA